MALTSVLTDDESDFDPVSFFGGWQVDLAAGLLAVLLLSIAVVSAQELPRAYRALRGLTPHRRAVVLAMLWPGIALGGVAGVPMRSALNFAARHTSAAAAAAREARDWQVQYRKRPPSLPAPGPAALPTLAAHLLHPADLGTGWFDLVTPNPMSQRVSAADVKLGATSAATTWLTKNHWAGDSWTNDQSLSERVIRFRTPAAAAGHAGEGWPKPGCATCQATVAAPSTQLVDGVKVSTGLVTTGNRTTRQAAFTVGGDTFVLSVDRPASAADFEQIVRVAVRKARSR